MGGASARLPGDGRVASESKGSVRHRSAGAPTRGGGLLALDSDQRVVVRIKIFWGSETPRDTSNRGSGLRSCQNKTHGPGVRDALPPFPVPCDSARNRGFSYGINDTGQGWWGPTT